MILRSTGNSMVNIPHEHWKKYGWKLNDEVEVKCDKDTIIITKKK